VIRLNADYIYIDTPKTFLFFGGEMTLPTAYAVKKGLYGNHFSKNAGTPELNLCKLCNLIQNNEIIQVQEILTNFLVESLDRLSRILLETSLGNNGHVGIGPVVEYRNLVTPKLEFRTRANLEYLMPACERRFFIFKKNQADFDRLNPDGPDTYEQLKFLEQQIVETFFPQGYNTIVLPGFIFKLTTALNGALAKNKIHIQLGQDLWWQQAEQFGRISAPEKDRERLRTDIAKRPAAFQSKIFGSVTYFRRGRKYDWCVKLYGDDTILRSGIGKDFNIGLRFELLL